MKPELFIFALFIATISHAVAPHLQSVPYDALKDFEPLAGAVERNARAVVLVGRSLREGNVEGAEAGAGELDLAGPVLEAAVPGGA